MRDIFQWAARHGLSNAALAELTAILDPSVMERAPAGDMKTEAGVQTSISIEAPNIAGAMWRNNSGVLMDERGIPVRFGLGNTSKKLNERWKSSDLIGITPVRITEAMVGRVVGVFTAAEVKEPGWKKPRNARERGQEAFIQTVRSKGGIAGFVQSVGDYRKLIDTWLVSRY